MRVFIAGATGVLGRRVVHQLAEAGHDVTGVARSPEKAQDLRTAGAAPVQVDLFDPAAVRAAVDGHDAVCNLATSIPPASRMALPSAWAMNDRLRTDASGILADAAIAVGAGRYVQESIGLVYADGGERWIDESSPVDAAEMTATALVAEQHAARVTSAGGRGVALRFAQFVAPDSQHMQVLGRIVARGWLPLLGPSDGYTSFVAADDAAAAVVAALDAPAGIYNVAEDEPLTRAEHAEVLSEVLGRPVRLPPALLGSLPRVRVQARSQRIDNRSLRTATSWSPGRASMREGWPALLAGLRAEVRDAA